MKRRLVIVYAGVVISCLVLLVFRWIGIADRPGAWMVHVASAIFGFSVFVLVPINVCIDMRHRRAQGISSNKYHWWEWLLLVPILRADRNAEIPGWLAYPITIFGVVFGSAILLVLAVALFRGWVLE